MLLSEDMTEWSVSIKKYVRNISVKQKCSHRCQEICPKIGTPDLVVLFTNTVSHKWCGVQWKKQAAAMQRSSAAIQAAKTHWKISWKLPVQQCKNDQLQKSKIEEKYRKMYKKESIRYEICMVYSLLI